MSTLYYCMTRKSTQLDTIQCTRQILGLSLAQTYILDVANAHMLVDSSTHGQLKTRFVESAKNGNFQVMCQTKTVKVVSAEDPFSWE